MQILKSHHHAVSKESQSDSGVLFFAQVEGSGGNASGRSRRDFAGYRQSRLPPSNETIDTLCQVAKLQDSHGYQPYTGLPALREGMAKFYKRFFDVEFEPSKEILPLIGSKEGILHVTLAFVNPGDCVLVPDPGYPTYTSLSTLLGAKVVKYDLTYENGWHPDFNQLENLMAENHPKLVWTNYPHMPTGAPARRETYEKLVKLALKYDTVIVNDNPYSLILNHDYQSIFQIPDAKKCCIEFNSMSKSHNMPGWRVGMLLANETFVNWVLKVKSNIDSGTFKGIQMAAAAAFDNSGEWHEEHNVRVYQRRRAIAEEIMTALGCTFDKKQVGMFLWGRIPENVKNVEDLTERVLHENHVFITPGFIFGENGKRFVRISLCANEEMMREALNRIKNTAD